MPHNDDPDEEYPIPEETVITNAVYAAQKARIVELTAQLATVKIGKQKVIERLLRLEQAISEIRALIESLPSGIDYEANPNNTSPADAVAFTGGLIWQICERVK